jgi:tetratricopeptide (TPR) repeat protein
MFFPRLRRQAKWVFVLLVLVFGLGFVFLGVGSGSGVGDLLYDRFGELFGSSTGLPSVGDAEEEARENPRDPQAQRDLATAYSTAGRTEEAVGALRRYVELRPRDEEALQELATLQLANAESLSRLAALALQEQQEAAFGQIVGPQPQGVLAQALGTDPIVQAITTDAQERYGRAYGRAETAYRGAVASFKRLAALQPTIASVQQDLALASESAGDARTAIAAWKRYLELAPDAVDADAVRQRVKQLQAQAAVQAATSTATPAGSSG